VTDFAAASSSGVARVWRSGDRSMGTEVPAAGFKDRASVRTCASFLKSCCNDSLSSSFDILVYLVYLLKNLSESLKLPRPTAAEERAWTYPLDALVAI